MRESGKPLDETMPEGKAVPQLNISIGPRPPAASASAARSTRPGTVGDAAARCQAEESDSARARCRAELARSSAPKAR